MIIKVVEESYQQTHPVEEPVNATSNQKDTTSYLAKLRQHVIIKILISSDMLG
jgi:hypothetical protein